jgi:hypothetical protein
MLSLMITDAADLDEVNGEIHDWFFDIEDVAFDRQAAELTIPFRRWSYEEARLIGEDPPVTGWRKLFGTTTAKSWEAPWYRWVLRIQNADSYRLQDDARIGCGDFNEISYDLARSSLIVRGSIPVTIEARVHAIAVSVEQTNELLGIARYRTFGGSDSYTGEVLPLPEDDESGPCWVRTNDLEIKS